MKKNGALPNIGDNIRKIREQKGLSQKEVALAIDVAPTQYSRLENGKALPSLPSLLKVAKVLDVKLDVLVFGEDNLLKEVNIKDKSLLDKVRILEGLPDEEKNAVLTVMELAVSKKKFKEFFQEQLTK